MKDIFFRFFKVIYILILLFGIILGILVWNFSASNTYSYLVQCTNGKSFDPLSKPIEIVDYSEPYSFSDAEIKSECAYGTAYYVNNDLKNNYDLTYQLDSHTIDRNRWTVIWVFGYYLLVNIIKRTILYIFFGKNFLTGK